MAQSISTPASFEEIVKYCREYIKNIEHEKEWGFAKILGFFPSSIEKNFHFEILGSDMNKILSIEFHIEGKEVNKTLQIFIKYLEGVSVFDKKIQYDPIWRNKGRLRIGCDYSYGAEKICAYIYEFIYQVNSRIQNILTLGKSK